MKHTILLALLMANCLHNFAQPKSIVKDTFAIQAAQYLNQYSSSFNTTKAFQLYQQSASLGNARAMNAIAVQYKQGLGVDSSTEQAIQWFTKAGNAGYAKAWYNLAMLYKNGNGVLQNFAQAYTYLTKAAAMGDAQSIYAVGYFNYKGLGCVQDYSKAANLFAQGAKQRSPNSMYFLGLCLRNGYGVVANADSATYWLQLAAKRGYKMASDELAMTEPENAGEAGALADKIKAAKAAIPQNIPLNQFAKVQQNMPAADVEGSYSGYLLKYDWSGTHVVSAAKLEVQLSYQNGKITGLWQEDDSLNLPIHAVLTPKALVFDAMQYHKKGHYNPIKPELLSFEKARLQFIKNGDTVYLAGNLQMFAPERNEPTKPQFIALTRTKSTHSDSVITMVNEDGSMLTAYALHAFPNPFTTILTVDFELKQSCYVQVQLLTLDGKVVYSNAGGTLAAGSYTLPLQPTQVAAGTYLLRLQYGNKQKATQVIKL